MIGSSLHQVSRARSNTARLLALFLTLSVIEGLYFSQEVLIFGFALSGYVLISFSRRHFKLGLETSSTLGLTDFMLLGMLFLSMLGVLQPVKVKEGWLEALRWGIFWFAYRLGLQVSSSETEKQRLALYIKWLAISVALIGWLPFVSKVAGRLSSVFGYPNAAAAFLGAVLLLTNHSKPVQIFLGISLLGTGSRAGVILTVIILIGRQILLGFPSLSECRQKYQAQQSKGLWLILVAFASTFLMFFYNRPVWDNLMSFGFSSTSWQERLVYLKDGIRLAWMAGGLPHAGGWMAFPTVQRFPYWTADPHSSLIHVLLNQGVLGILSLGIWSSYYLIQAWKYVRKNHSIFKTRIGFEATKAQVRVWSALLFLGLHSLVDADFSFGALGFLFWLLFGSLRKKEERIRMLGSNKVTIVLSLILCLLSGSALINPSLLAKEQSWNREADQWRSKDPAKSLVLWEKSLAWDQTQKVTRREQAELLLFEGNVAAGIKAVEEAIRWQPFDLETYEWAQSVVWRTAEVQRRIHPEQAVLLYHWVESVPQMIEGKVAKLTPSDRLLWRGYQEFRPSQHIKFLAENTHLR